MQCGVKQVDAFVRNSHSALLGMSSRIGTIVSAAIMNIQTAHKLAGDAIEIGVFEGRSAIPLAMCLQGTERLYAVDPCDWPDDGVEARLINNLERHSVRGAIKIVKKRSTEIAAEELAEPGATPKMRFCHIDGDHTYDSLYSDVRLMLPAMEPFGVLCLDDMLHPGYPDLFDAVEAALSGKSDWIVFAIIDRENIVASAKFMLCDPRMADFYKKHLAYRFPSLVWGMPGKFRSHEALVLTPFPALAKVRS